MLFKKELGAIITTRSISRLYGEPALVIDTASRAAVVTLTRSLAIDDARLGIIRRGNVLLK